MAEYEMSGRELGIRALIVFSLATGTVVLALNQGSSNDEINALNQDHDGKPALLTGSPNTELKTSASQNSAVSKQDTLPVCEPTPPGHLTNPSTCADYKLVNDPSGLRTCVEKGDYTIPNPRTLWGMKAVLGDPTSQTDGDVTIYDSSGSPIGYFADGIPATFEGMNVQAEVDAFACLNE